MRRVLLLAALLAATSAFAHVGSPNAFFEGNAGPYPLRVVVKQPGVVPGLADISVRTAADATRVAAKPVKWDVGEAGSPPADPAKRIAGDGGAWTASLWLMARGSYSVYIDVDGPRGHGRAIVPITAVATTRLPMPRALTALLLVLGALLAAGVVTLVAAGAREAVLPVGAEVDPAARRRGRIAWIGGTVVVVLLLARGRSWWNNVDAEYRRSMFKPLHITTSIDRAGLLNLRIDDRDWHEHPERYSPLMPDHGKMMHLFLVGERLDALAHLHPRMLARDHFQTTVPGLPPGRYHLFADITNESGFAQTLIDRVDVAASSAMRSDEDDAVYPAAVQPATIRMLPVSLLAGRDTDLRFSVLDADGRPAAIEPYMGMSGHAVIVRDDFSVFVHAHPMGTVSMAAQERFAARDHLGMPMQSMAAMAPADGVVSFPYAFPKPGRYHLWLQSKVNGAVATGAFAVDVR